jgi:alpha-mannosidase
MERIGWEALARNEKPYVLPFCPPGSGKRPRAGIVLNGPAVELAAFKKAEDGDDLVVRLFEPTGIPRAVTLILPPFGARKKVRLRGFEVKTLRFSPRAKTWAETDLMERRFKKK